MYGFNQNSYLPNYNSNFSNNYTQPTADERIWVQNQTSAEAYLVAPNSFVRLWDSSVNRFYEKRADASGRPFPLEVFEYKRIDSQNEALTSKPSADYSEDIKSLNERITELEKEVKYVSKSYTNDTTVQPIQTELHRESRGRGKEASRFWENESEPTKPATEYGYRVSKNDEEL